MVKFTAQALEAGFETQCILVLVSSVENSPAVQSSKYGSASGRHVLVKSEHMPAKFCRLCCLGMDLVDPSDGFSP